MPSLSSNDQDMVRDYGKLGTFVDAYCGIVTDDIVRPVAAATRQLNVLNSSSSSGAIYSH